MYSLYFMQKSLRNYAFIDSQNVNLGIRELGWKLRQVPNARRYSALLKKAAAEEYLDCMNNLKGKLIYKNKTKKSTQ